MSDSPVLDGLPLDWPHDMAPGQNLASNFKKRKRSSSGRDSHESDSKASSTNAAGYMRDAASQPNTSPLVDDSHLTEAGEDSPRALKEPAGPPTSARVRSTLDDPGIRDLGWNDGAVIPSVLVPGMTNEQVFMYIRRFNQHVHCVCAVSSTSLDMLDLEVSEDEEATPDKLRANLERVYVTIIVGVAAFAKHIARIRSWNEPRRTAGFCAAYFIAWRLSFLPLLLLATAVACILHPPARRALFPPAPLAAIDSSSGNLQLPRAGALGSHGSLSGAPEVHEGEAAEREAAQFVASVAAIGAGAVVGEGESGMPGTDGEDDEAGMPDASDLALRAQDSKDAAEGVEEPEARVAKKSVEGAVWEKMGPVVHVLGEAADTWERLANALEPTPLFPQWTGRIRLASALAPLVIVALLVPAAVVVRAATFAFGVVFFSQPMIARTVYSLTCRYPHWTHVLELRRSLLKGIPTDAQVALALLRQAEAANAPLPPPPRTAEPTTSLQPETARSLKAHDFAFDASEYPVEGAHAHHTDSEGSTFVDDELDADGSLTDPSTGPESVDGESVLSSPTSTQGDGNADDGSSGGKKRRRRRGSKLVGFLRKTTRAGVETVLGADRVKAKAGNERARRRLGAVVPPEDVHVDSHAPTREEAEQEPVDDAQGRAGPTSFAARMNGKKGRVVLISSATSPCLAFVPSQSPSSLRSVTNHLHPSHSPASASAPHASFLIPLSDIVALRKLGGLGWKGRLAVGWSTGRAVLGGLEVEDGQGTRWAFTAVRERDALFARLVAIGGQRWARL